MASEKRIKKYKQTEKVVSTNSLQDPSSFRRNRRHSWFGNLLGTSGDVGSNPSVFNPHEVDEHQLSFNALDLKANLDSKPTSNSSMIKQAAQVFGFGSDAHKTKEVYNAKTQQISEPPNGVNVTQAKMKTSKFFKNPTRLGTPYMTDTTHAANLASFLNQPSSSVPNFSRLSQRRATVHYSSTGRPSLMDYQRRSTAYCSLRPNEIRAKEQFKDVCRDYIVYKLRQHNLINRVNIDREQSKEHSLLLEIVFISKELKRMQRKYFTDIASQIGVTIRSEEVLRKIFFELSNEIITTEVAQSNDRKKSDSSATDAKVHQRKHLPPLRSCTSRCTEVTWGRLCAVLVVTGGLAIDCVQQGHANLVNYLIEYVGEFAQEEDILKWIVEQGGWEALRNLTEETNATMTETEDSSNYNRLTNTALVFILCTIGGIFAAFTAGNLTV